MSTVTTTRLAPNRPGAPPTSVLELNAVSRSFGGVRVLDPLTLVVEPGTLTVVTGHNGSGKSTLLRLAAGLLTPSLGSRRCAGTAVYLASGGGLRSRQRTSQAVASAAALSGRRLDRATLGGVLAQVGLGADLWWRPVGQLSSGQRARLTLAVALGVGADVVCLDEPSAHLDAGGSQAVTEAVEALTERGAAVLLATHDPTLAAASAHARIQLERGAVTGRETS